MLDFKEFSKLAVEHMEKNLRGDYHVSVIKFCKSNGEQAEGLLVKCGKYPAGPGIALDSLYAQYVKMGGGVSDYINPILKIYNKNTDLPAPMGPVSETWNWENVQGHVVYRLVNAGENPTILAESPHTLILDLARVYYLDFPGSFHDRFFVRIRNEMLKRWKVSTEDLHLCAQRNMPEHFPAKIYNIRDVLEGKWEEFTKEETEDRLYPPLYVLTNQEACFGAAAMLYGNSLEQFANRCLSNVVILPSSVHEVLLFPEDGHTDYKMLRKMVETVNDQNVPAEERLSSHVYRYLRDSKKIEIADEN